MNPDDTQRRQSTVLVVDDEAEICELASRVLLRDGYCVLVAGNGEEALRIAEESENAIGLLLCDMDMPRMTGKVLAERLMATRRNLKVLYMSGHTLDRLARMGLVPGADQPLLSKPFTVADLSDTVREVLGSRPLVTEPGNTRW